MKKIIVSSLLACCFATLPAAAETITLAEPGTLSEQLTDTNVKELTVSGPVNALDLVYISELPALKSVDLANVEIKAYEGKMIGTVTRHGANVIPANVFAGAKFTTIALPTTAGLKISSGAFAESGLETIVIPSTVASVGDGAFAGCPELVSADCNVAALGVGVFAQCPKLENVKFGCAVALPANAFYGCGALTSVKGDVTSVGDHAMAYCRSLSSFPFGNVEAIGAEAFMGAGLSSVALTKCKTVGEWAFAMMPNLTELSLGNAVELGQAVAFACPKLKNVTTPETVSEVPDFAFSKSAAVDTLGLLPDNIERIGRYALSGLSGIHVITLPASIESLDDHAMENMTSLERIDAEMYYIPEVGEDVWAGIDQSKVELVVPNEMIDEFKAADQWCEFKVINSSSSSADTVVDEILPELQARFDADDLIVRAGGVEIEQLLLYDPAGRLLIAVEPMEDTIVVNTAGFNTRYYIIHASLADGRTAALKLAK